MVGVRCSTHVPPRGITMQHSAEAAGAKSRKADGLMCQVQADSSGTFGTIRTHRDKDSPSER